MRNDDAWFVRSPAGLSYWPVRWPGWALLLGYVAAIVILPTLMPRLPWLYVGLVSVLTMGMVVVTIRTSRRG